MINWSDYFYYDETSPSCLRWKVDRYTGGNGQIKISSKGEPAGIVHNETKYWCVYFNWRCYKCHRIIWFILKGDIPDDMMIDHINGDKNQNHIENLRLVNPSGNCRNKKQYITNTSGVTGVYFDHRNGRFRAVWVGADLTFKTKSFSINKYGYDEAFRLACEYREKMILALNAQGAGYTERHGKE